MLAWSYAPIVAALWAFHRAPSIATFALAFVTAGVRMNALFVVAHESWHYNLFRSRKLNEWLGGALAGYPMVIPYFHNRNTHWSHHRYVGTLRDPDAWAWDWPDAKRGALARELFFVASGLGQLGRIVRVLTGRPSPPPPPDRPAPPALEGAAAKKEIARLAVVHLAILGAFAATIGWVWYVPLWLVPALTLGPACLMLRELLEHRRGALIVYRANPLERFLLGCFNFHLHAYHHAYASAPWFALPAIEARARKKAPGIVTLDSYVAEFVAYFRGTSTVPVAATATSDAQPAGDVPLADRADTGDDEAA